MSSDATSPTVYERIGPGPLEALATGLYRRVDRDERLRGMFSHDLGPDSAAVRDMCEFLIQRFGGPATYSTRKGHPRLRARHLRFPITIAARNAWLAHAIASLEEVQLRFRLGEEAVLEIRSYLEQASLFLVNQSDDSEALPESHGTGT